MSLGTLWHRRRQIRRTLDRLALPLGLIGLAGVALYNWHRWQKDKALLDKMKDPPLPPLETWPELPVVSVLVAAWNEADFVRYHIESFLALRYPHKELLLCAGGDDGTYRMAKQYEGQQVKVLQQQSGEGKQRALARSFPLSRGEIIFLTDADCLLDDDAFERTLYPVAAGEEEVVTGSSTPLPEQLDNPLVFSQAASQLYGSTRAAPYVGGLLGGNCAVSQSVLEQSRALEADAATGTDYVTAKMLILAGARIRQLRYSRVMTDYPMTIRAYLKQQNRWLRNVVLHGCRFRAYKEVLASLRTSLIGLLMLLIPVLSPLISPRLLIVWSVPFLQALLARCRYLLFCRQLLGSGPSFYRVLLWQPILLLLDFVAWTGPLLNCIRPARREAW